MGSALSTCGIDLSGSVISSLIPFNSIHSLKFKEISHALTIEGHHHAKLPAGMVFKLLKPYFDNPKPLVSSFMLRTGPCDEEFVNMNYLLAALCFFSKCTGIQKSRCNIYLVLFGLFVRNETRSLKLHELTKLIKSVIIGVFHMTGKDLPDNSLYRKLADEFMVLADSKHIKRINTEEFISFLKCDGILMQIDSEHGPSFSTLEKTLPIIHYHNNVFYIQTSITSSPRSVNMKDTVRHNNRSLSLTASVKLPQLVSRQVACSFSPNERVIYEAYTILLRDKSQVSEKGDFYLDLSYYLINQCKHKPIFMARTDWSNNSISLEEAIETFKSYFDYLEDLTTRSYRKRETVKHNEIEVYARLFEKGDTERIGWDKSDVFDIIGKNSSANAYYLIEKHGITRNNRLQFREFLRSCLPDHKKFDESNVNRYYSAVIKEENSQA